MNIYDIFALYTIWNIFTNQVKVTNYTSWNIETKLMTLVTYTSRCRKLHLKLSTLPMCSDGWKPRGKYTVWRSGGPCNFSPLSGQDSTGAIETGLQRRHIACGGQCHMKTYTRWKCLYIKWTWGETYQIKCLYIMHIGGETYQIKFLYIKWTCDETYQIKCLCIKWICSETYQIKFLYIKWICGETYQIKFLYIKQICSETYQMKCLYIKQTYIILDNTPNKISKNIFMSFGHYLKYFKKKKFKSKKHHPRWTKRGSDCWLSSTTA